MNAGTGASVEPLIEVVSETVGQGPDGPVVERRFDLILGDTRVPGVQWLPPGDAPCPTVCIGHGGFQHKRIDNVLALGQSLVGRLGIGAVALDAIEHGERASDPEASTRALRELASGDRDAFRRHFGAAARAAMAARAKVHVAEWRAMLDALQADPRTAAGPFGWWGVSMGTTHGLPLVATDDRVAAAVFGLNALRPGDEEFGGHAAAVTVPVLFLNQWDDELMTRETALALWDALGSHDKTMHVNPGRHVEVPRFERDASIEFFRRHLLAAPH